MTDVPSRIPPLEPPYDAAVDELLRSMMPPGVPPIALFRTFAHNEAMSRAMRPWGGYELGRELRLSMREREIVIDRTTARCGCEYEWGVHVAFFAERVGFDAAQTASLVHGGASDACWSKDRERLLIALVDELHETSGVSDGLWSDLEARFDHAELLDALFLCGWYHAISFVANGAAVALEEFAPRFVDVDPAG